MGFTQHLFRQGCLKFGLSEKYTKFRNFTSWFWQISWFFSKHQNHKEYFQIMCASQRVRSLWIKSWIQSFENSHDSKYQETPLFLQPGYVGRGRRIGWLLKSENWNFSLLFTWEGVEYTAVALFGGSFPSSLWTQLSCLNGNLEIR